MIFNRVLGFFGRGSANPPIATAKTSIARSTALASASRPTSTLEQQWLQNGPMPSDPNRSSQRPPSAGLGGDAKRALQHNRTSFTLNDFEVTAAALSGIQAAIVDSGKTLLGTLPVFPTRPADNAAFAALTKGQFTLEAAVAQATKELTAGGITTKAATALASAAADLRDAVKGFSPRWTQSPDTAAAVRAYQSELGDLATLVQDLLSLSRGAQESKPAAAPPRAPAADLPNRPRAPFAIVASHSKELSLAAASIERLLPAEHWARIEKGLFHDAHAEVHFAAAAVSDLARGPISLRSATRLASAVATLRDVIANLEEQPVNATCREAIADYKKTLYCLGKIANRVILES